MPAPSHELSWAFRSHWPSPFDQIAAAQRREVVSRCERKLPQASRKVIRLRYRFGLTVAQTAVAMQLTEQGVDRVSGQALRCMREQLESEGIRRLEEIL